MSAVINYLLEVSVCWGVFYLFYVAVLYDQPSYQYNRFYLLAASLLGALLPLLEVPLGTVQSGSAGAGYILLDPFLTLDSASTKHSSFQWRWDYFFWIVYGSGAVVAAAYYFWQFLSVVRIIRHGQLQQAAQPHYQLLHTQGKFPTSSFFQFLLWDNTQTLSDSETQQMIAHEETHIRQKHSYDIIYFTLLKIVFWFHPLVYLLERVLVENHEFAADAGALQHPAADRRTYSRLLARQSMARLQWAVVNHFYKSKTLKRIKMMEKKNRTIWYRYALIVPVVASLFLVFSCQPDTEELERETIAQTYDELKAQSLKVNKQQGELIKKYYDNPEIFWDEVRNVSEKSAVAGAKPSDHNDLRLEIFKRVASESDFKVYQSLLKRHKTLHEKLMSMPDPDGVYMVVENQPSPEGGMKPFYQHIMQELKYPKEARQKGIEGKVFVQFVVNEYGELTNFQALKGIGAGCDEAAIKALKSAPAWNPGTTEGKPVPVRMVLPVTFKLGDSDASGSSSPLSAAEENSPNKMEETVVVGYDPKN
jgi:TonB family protein